MKFFKVLFLLLLFLVLSSKHSYTQTITGCRTPDAQRIYYTPASPSDNGNIYNRIFYYLPSDNYQTNYSGTDIACTIKNPTYYATGQSGDYGQCVIKFAFGDVAGQVYRGQLTPCSLPLDDYIPFFLFGASCFSFFILNRRQIIMQKNE